MNLTVLEETSGLARVSDELGEEFWISKERLNRRIAQETASSLRVRRSTEESKMDKVKRVMSDCSWRNVKEIAKLSEYGSNESGLTAAIRSFRKPEYGGYAVEKRYTDVGEYEYRFAPQTS